MFHIWRTFKVQPDICEPQSWSAFLDGSLSRTEEQVFISHLDQCSECAAGLEKLAADDRQWEDVATHLANTETISLSSPRPETSKDNLPFAIRQLIGMLAPSDDPQTIGRLGMHEVFGVVGSGAMGIVLKAHDPTLDRIVALKVMNPTLATCGTARYRFAREAKAAAGILHSNVIPIHAVSTERDLPYLVMPYISGTSLQQRVNRQGPLALVEILRIGSQVAAGLAAAHQKGLIHRDIKPANIMLDEGVETALITDFGLAQTIDDATMTRTGALTGTPEYMSPEQARGEAVDFASDVFSLGSVLYTLCTGTRPFRAKTSYGVLRKITDEVPTPIREITPDIPLWLCDLIDKMHSKSTAERPHSTQVCKLLEGCLAHAHQPEKISLPRELTQADARQPTKSSPNYLAGILVAMSVISIAFLAIMMQPGNTPPNPDNSSATSTLNSVTDDQPSVFKTIKLDFPDEDRIGLLTVDINRGSIEVTGHDQSGVVIEILTPPKYDKRQDRNSEFVEVFAPKYDLRKDKKKNEIELDTYNQDYVLNVRIKVPHETDLNLDTYRSGHLIVKDVSGTIHTHSEHNDIQLVDISGSASAFSRNGDLTIQFVEVAKSAKLDFESYNGKIDLTLPASIKTSTAISTGIGSYRSAFKIESADDAERPKSIVAKVKRNVDEYQFGKINGGGVPLRIENENGQIQIRKR